MEPPTSLMSSHIYSGVIFLTENSGLVYQSPEDIAVSSVFEVSTEDIDTFKSLSYQLHEEAEGLFHGVESLADRSLTEAGLPADTSQEIGRLRHQYITSAQESAIQFSTVCNEVAEFLEGNMSRTSSEADLAPASEQRAESLQLRDRLSESHVKYLAEMSTLDETFLAAVSRELDIQKSFLDEAVGRAQETRPVIVPEQVADESHSSFMAIVATVAAVGVVVGVVWAIREMGSDIWGSSSSPAPDVGSSFSPDLGSSSVSPDLGSSHFGYHEGRYVW
ncbi:hypothetical protein [Streptomyces sp. NPDC057910]|uniref:hypothetical protein n=1 Tax=Streptomyces sp. NPDC057910 TaxID=3346278 RepID=UPI0036EAFA6C